MLSNASQKRGIRKRLEVELDELARLIGLAQGRLRKLDSQMVSDQRSFSPRGGEYYVVLKQLINALEQRGREIEQLLETGRGDSLYLADEIMHGPLENGSDGIDSTIFSELIVSLLPDQFQVAIDMLFDALEADLNRVHGDLPVEEWMGRKGRQRKYTIRRLMRSLTHLVGGVERSEPRIETQNEQIPKVS